MATLDPTSSPSGITAVPAAFHYETKYILLNYLGMLSVGRSQMPSTDQGDAQNKKERDRRLKEEIKKELRQLEVDISASVPGTGFDINLSPVFRPANPENSVEDCLATIGDKVAQDLDTHLPAAVQTLLTGPLDYQRFRSTILDLSAHTQEGWNKVAVPLVLLQALQSQGQPLTTLLQLGLCCLEEDKAADIVQLGGWGNVLGLVPEDKCSLTIAEDSNDICVIPEEQHPEQPSPPSLLLCTGDNGSDQSSWQTESLPVSLAGHESWAQVSAMDPEDVKSLDSNEGVALADERSENNSSNSDIVHVEREDTELLEEGAEAGVTEESMISVLGTESELAELRAEFGDQTPAAPASAGADSTPPASLISLEEPVVIETPASLSEEPSLVSSEPELLPPVPDLAASPPAEPKPPTPLPVPAEEPEPEPESAAAPAPVPSGVEIPAPAKETITAPAEPEATSEPATDAPQKTEPVTVPHQPEPEAAAEPDAETSTAEEAPVAPVEAPVAFSEAQTGKTSVETPGKEDPVELEPAAKIQALLYGGAALVLLAAVSIGIIFLRRR
ncbi:bcl-2-like protein 13 [Kryptolebias marmoratus]|uniref:BCL2 like 13 n=1 Tax=Kryptolebias marmoratus TaxID=37003 RepID=A0A3Q3BH01_KRYMA|nr:bcl-2-like protein 13 [Kryptolebias marmoratus]XP_037834087.1 bcl-2-like protein 13 [Kryptolebias marmoratus]